MKVCSIEGCARPMRKRSWCNTHYQRWRITGTTDDKFPPTCTVDGCAKPYKARGYCDLHLQRFVRHGDPLGSYVRPSTRERILSGIAGVNGCWEWMGTHDRSGYGKISVGGRGVPPRMVHRVSFEVFIGPIPEGMQIDHRCHNRSCCNPNHLRVVTNKQNVENPAGIRIDNTSGHQGVSWSKKDKKWRAYANHNGRYYSAGHFDDKEDAAEAARLKRLELFTHNDRDRQAA